MKIRIYFFLSLLVTLYCSAQTERPSQLNTLKIFPHDTDSAIDTYTGGEYMHYVYLDSGVKKLNRLFLFLPGTNGKGGGCKDLNITAARLGYHVINLIYPDGISMSSFTRSNNKDAYSQGREEVITGVDSSVSIKVNRANCIENRLIRLLQYLQHNYPGQGWDNYLDKKWNIVWEKIVVGGLSQGGGHAAFIAKKHKVARVLMFGAPKDFSIYYNCPVSWLYRNSATPIQRYFSFVHSLDDHNGCTFPQQEEIWKVMGMYQYGKLVNVEETIFPFNNTRLLTSTLPQNSPHGSVAHDPVYTEIWRYMLQLKVE